MEFKLEGKEKENADLFIKQQMEIDDTLPTAGERFTYCFTPTGIGTVIKIIDEFLDTTQDITDWDVW